MERIKQDFFARAGAFILVLAFVTGLPVSAEVILAERPAQGSPQPHQYPESFFGQEPAKPMLPGASRIPASLAHSAPARGPASMGSDEPPSTAQTYPSIVPSSHRGVQEVSLIASDLGYFPKTLFVTKDVPVRLYVTGTSRTKQTLCLMMDAFNVKKQVRSKRVEEIHFTPSVAGQYRYYCPTNGMEGTLVVKEN